MGTYIPNTEFRTPESSILPHVALYVVQFAFLIGPCFPGRKQLFCALVVVFAIQAHLNPHFSNDPAIVQPFTIGYSYYLDTLSKFLFSGDKGPEGHFWPIQSPAQEALRFNPFGWKKICWAFSLVFNQRGVRWNHQVKNVPNITASNRARFLVLQAFQFVKCLLIADLLLQLSIRINFTAPDGTVGKVNSAVLTLNHADWRWSLLKVFTFGCTPYFMLSSQYALLAFIGVAIGMTKPEAWPLPFGKLRETTTVRSFWGKFWHQQLRRTLSSYTDKFADLIGIPRGTNLSSYTKLYLAFAISGGFHALSQLQMPSPVNVTAKARTTGIFYFFIWQAAAITFEDFVQWCWRQTSFGLGSKTRARLSTLVGYIWVFIHLWISLPSVGDAFIKIRMGADNMLPFTVLGPIVKQYVPIPPP